MDVIDKMDVIDVMDIMDESDSLQLFFTRKLWVSQSMFTQKGLKLSQEYI